MLNKGKVGVSPAKAGAGPFQASLIARHCVR